MSEQTDAIEIIEVKTIAEVERIVHGSGLWDGTSAVEFSDDGADWTEAWTPTDAAAHPQFARVSVYRKDVRIPTTVTIRWDEQFPQASDEWAGKWTRSPMRHFGRTVRMVGFRQTFRELLGNIRIEDEADERATEAPADIELAPGAEVLIADQIAAAETLEEIDAIERAGRRVRAFTPDKAGTDLFRALRARRRELTPVAEAWSPDAVDDAPAPAPVAAAERTAPQDYLPPVNRADRRKAARRKGRR